MVGSSFRETAAGRFVVLEELHSARVPTLDFLDGGLAQLLAEAVVVLDDLVGDAGGRVAQGLLEVVLVDDAGLAVLAQGDDGGFAAQGLDVGADVALGELGDVREVDVLAQRHAGGVHLQDVEARALVWGGDLDEAVEAAGAQQAGVDDVGPVGGGDDDDALEAFHAVDRGQQLVDDALRDVAALVGAAAGGDAVDLVEEDDAGRALLGLLEDLAHGLLGLADPLRQDLGALDGEEVGAGLVGDGLGQQRLAGARGPVQEDAARRLDAHALEGHRVLQRPLDGLLELLLDVGQAADGLPGDVGDLDQELAQGGGVDDLERALEVVRGDLHLLQELGGDGLVQVDLGQVAAQRLHGGLAGEGHEVGADEAVRGVGEVLEVDVLGLGHVARLDLQDLEAALLVGHADLDLAVEAPGAAQRRIDGVGPVGGADDDDLAAALEAVHQGQHLRHDAALHFALHLVALGRDGVHLVDEDDAGRVLLGLLEGLAQVLLGLAVELAHDLRAVDGVELGAGLVGDGLGDHGLARAGRAVQQHALGRVDAQ